MYANTISINTDYHNVIFTTGQYKKVRHPNLLITVSIDQSISKPNHTYVTTCATNKSKVQTLTDFHSSFTDTLRNKVVHNKTIT